MLDALLEPTEVQEMLEGVVDNASAKAQIDAWLTGELGTEDAAAGLSGLGLESLQKLFEALLEAYQDLPGLPEVPEGPREVFKANRKRLFRRLIAVEQLVATIERRNIEENDKEFKAVIAGFGALGAQIKEARENIQKLAEAINTVAKVVSILGKLVGQAT